MRAWETLGFGEDSALSWSPGAGGGYPLCGTRPLDQAGVRDLFLRRLIPSKIFTRMRVSKGRREWKKHISTGSQSGPQLLLKTDERTHASTSESLSERLGVALVKCGAGGA